MSVDAPVASTVDLAAAHQQLQASLAGRLTDRAWHRHEELFSLVEDAWADAICRTVPAMIFSDLPDPLDYGRSKLIEAAIRHLAQQHKCERREHKGHGEVRLAPGVPLPGPIASEGPPSSPPTMDSRSCRAPDQALTPAKTEPTEPTLRAEGVAGTVRIGDYDFVIDPEFSQLLGDPSDDEARQFDDNLDKDQRVLAPIVRWKGTDIVLDGHHRIQRLLRKPLPFGVEDIELPDRPAALDWILNHQAGQRNITPERLSYLRGRLYQSRKQSHGGNRRPIEGPRCQNDNLRTDEVLGAQFGVSPSTIYRDGQFASQVDQVVESCGPSVKQHILGKHPPLDRKQVAALAELSPDQQPEAVQAALGDVKARTSSDRRRKAARKQRAVPAASPPLPRNDLRLDRSDGPDQQAHALIEGLGKERAAELRDALDRALGPRSPEFHPDRHNAAS